LDAYKVLVHTKNKIKILLLKVVYNKPRQG
jgi:hypothetical protein